MQSKREDTPAGQLRWRTSRARTHFRIMSHIRLIEVLVPLVCIDSGTRWIPRIALLLLGFIAAVVPNPATAHSPNILIRAGELHTVTNGVIRNGEILISDGLIEQIGMSVNAPADAQEYWAEVVIPGMIDAHAHLALDRSSRSRIPGPFTPEWRAVENLDLEDPMIQVALSGGVTSVLTRSGSGIISSGQSVALKMKSTPGPDMILKPYVDLKMAVRPLINLRPGETPQTVMGWYATADDYFRRAELYMAQQEATQRGKLMSLPKSMNGLRH